jgi:hypothetical protein
MNTANLQLEGLYTALAALIDLGKHKGLVSADEVDAALARAEDAAAADRPDLPPANLEAVCFPIRLLRLANQEATGTALARFSGLARRVGEDKDARAALEGDEALKFAMILEQERDA